MAEKRLITKKIISKIGTPKVVLPEVVVEEKIESLEPVESERGERVVKAKRTCHFCQSKTVPAYTDLATLRRYLTERAKILPKLKSSVCAGHQRAVSRQIKYARHLSLLPFVPKV